MKPYIMGFRQGKGKNERAIYVNMNLVSHMSSDGATGSVLMFPCAIGEEPAYVCVNESPESIIARMN
jgi:hypothetical protein